MGKKDKRLCGWKKDERVEKLEMYRDMVKKPKWRKQSRNRKNPPWLSFMPIRLIITPGIRFKQLKRPVAPIRCCIPKSFQPKERTRLSHRTYSTLASHKSHHRC